MGGEHPGNVLSEPWKAMHNDKKPPLPDPAPPPQHCKALWIPLLDATPCRASAQAGSRSEDLHRISSTKLLLVVIPKRSRVQGRREGGPEPPAFRSSE